MDAEGAFAGAFWTLSFKIAGTVIVNKLTQRDTLGDRRLKTCKALIPYQTSRTR